MAQARVLLLITGGIAAYKACYLTRLLVQAGFSVKVAMTDAATRFVTPATFEVLSGHPVATDLWGQGQTKLLDHIEYARWADLTVVAPATANLLAKAAHGIADDMVTTLLLAFDGPLICAPAMNDVMWQHPATRANVETLCERGVVMVGPGDGYLACGTVAEGRMIEPEAILAEVRSRAALIEAAGEKNGPVAFWSDHDVTIVAGPTCEAIDPVRFLTNRSTGVFGYALARQAVQLGARVTLISGPTNLYTPDGLARFVAVESAAEMATAVAAALHEGTTWLLMAAAVADYTPRQVAENKFKKDDLGEVWTLELERTVDILGQVVAAEKADNCRVVGFALETENLIERATAKLRAKNLDYIIANDPTAAGSGFGAGRHRIVLLGDDGPLWESESLPKTELAREILVRLADSTRDAGDHS